MASLQTSSFQPRLGFEDLRGANLYVFSEDHHQALDDVLCFGCERIVGVPPEGG
jgi:hypothetical protein